MDEIHFFAIDHFFDFPIPYLSIVWYIKYYYNIITIVTSLIEDKKKCPII
jgi:hypothetical protein